MGGEAIKAYQYFVELKSRRPRVTLLTHARCQPQLEHLFVDSDVRLIKDDAVMLFLWRSRLLRFLLNPYFHWKVKRAIPAICAPGEGNVVHYLCPISPVLPRFPPRGYRAILGPINGNISFPKGFAERKGRKARVANRLHKPVQKLLGVLVPEKKKFAKILVSGYARTCASLRFAGAADQQLVEVVDSGVSDD